MATFRPLNSKNTMVSNFSQVNDMMRQINKEQTTKTFKQANGNAIVSGKLPYEGGYGTLYYDTDGVPIIVIGILPDGTTGMVIAKAGQNVIDLF